MTTANEQPMSHADRHDLDKLSRWKEGLDASDDSFFPVCAIFLTTGEDRASHDIFRRYRSAFEELGGGFHNLVIFGQHGVSTTQTAFLGEFALAQRSIPALAIAPMTGERGAVYTIELPKGNRDGELDETQTWGVVLCAVGEAVSDGSALELGGISGVISGALRGGSLESTVSLVQDGLCGKS